MEGHLTLFISLAFLLIAGFILYMDLDEAGLFDNIKEKLMPTQVCLARTETTNGRTYPLLVFPDKLFNAKGHFECWSPIGGHSGCDKEYVLSQTKPMEEDAAQKLLSRYEAQYIDIEPVKLRLLKSWPK